jgi:hypothetical protein
LLPSILCLRPSFFLCTHTTNDLTGRVYRKNAWAVIDEYGSFVEWRLVRGKAALAPV